MPADLAGIIEKAKYGTLLYSVCERLFADMHAGYTLTRGNFLLEIAPSIDCPYS